MTLPGHGISDPAAPVPPESATALTLRLFGSFEARRGGARLQGLHLREGERLLAYLTLKHANRISYRTLAELFWPSEAHMNPGASGDFPNVRQALHFLRRALGNDGQRLVRQGKGIVRLDLAGADVDVIAFDTLVTRDDPASWKEAVGRYRAPLLQDWPEPWAQDGRARCRREYERILRRLIAWAEDDGEAEGYLRRLLASTPLAEADRRDLLALLARQGRYAEVEEEYTALADLLRAKDRAPETETVALIARLRAERISPRAQSSAPTGSRGTRERPTTPPASPQNAEEEGERLEPDGGVVPLDSGFYVIRPADHAFKAAIAAGDSIVLVKGARQMGKTSLLARGLQQAREQGARVVLTDFQKLNAAHLQSVESLFLTLGEMIVDQFDLKVSLDEVWNSRRGPNVNFERYLRREVLEKSEGPIVWAMDEVDRLFTCAFGSEVFGLFRSWHNERWLDPEGPWSHLTLAIAYATEAHLFISDLNQSPFNVGTRLTLEDFTLDQVADLNRRYGEPLPNPDSMSRFHRLVSGHPYLTRRGLSHMVTEGVDIAVLERTADREDGPFGDHLRRLFVSLSRDPEMLVIVRGVLRGGPCPAPESFYRLRSAGIVAGESEGEVRPRCRLYASYLSRHLL